MVGSLDRWVRRAPVVALVLILLPGGLAGPVASEDRAGPGAWVPGAATDAGPIAYGAADQGVERLYLAYFLRDPDPSGLSYWNEQRAAGMALGTISDQFATSGEFQSRYGALSDRDFVALVYQNVLSRAPDAGGYAYWLAQMAAGMTRGTLMTGFSESAEFRAAYQQHLQERAATGDGGDAGGTTEIQLGPDGLPAAPDGHYAFALRRPDGTPYTWAPCSTVAVVANFSGAPAGAEDVLVRALEHLSGATRIAWRYEGTTDERADSAIPLERPYTDPARYGDRYSPVLVSWPVDWSEGGSSIGYGGLASAWGDGDTPYAVTGWVTIDRGWQPPSGDALLSLLLHELGHVANLAHVRHADEVMYPIGTGHVAYQPGDLAGLARVGAWTADCSAD